MGKGTTWEPLQNILLARKINAAMGGAVVGPWDIDQLDDTTVDMILGLAEDLPGLKAGQQKIEGELQAWRMRHPTYKDRELRMKVH
ncbi:MAG TPA: hypothetical protein VJK02_13635 [Anaerolineales bacterium]|nr:hypothetical protein [Anaerolineales bacterium]